MRNKSLVFALLVSISYLFIHSAVSLAVNAPFEFQPANSFEKIQSEYRAGSISYKDYLSLLAMALLKPSAVPDRYKFSGEEIHNLVQGGKARYLPQGAGDEGLVFIKAMCGTPYLKEIDKNRDALSNSLDQYLSSRPAYTSELVFQSSSGRFYVHYSVDVADGNDAVPNVDSSDHGQGTGVYNLQNAPDLVEDYANIFENCWQVQVGDLGFDAPPEDGSTGGGTDIFDIYIQYISSYGVTYDPGSPYIVVDVSNNSNLRKVTAAHEFFHAIQANKIWDEGNWITEGTAMLMMDCVYDTVNNYIWYSLNDILSQPNTNLLNDNHNGYSAVLFWKFFIEKYGLAEKGGRCYLTADPDADPDTNGLDIIKEVYDEGENSDGTDLVDNVLYQKHQMSEGFQQAFIDWIITNYTKRLTGSTGGGWYDYLEDDLGYSSVPTSYSATIASGDVLDNITGSVNPWASNYVKLQMSTTAPPKSVLIEFNGGGTAVIGQDFVDLQVVCVNQSDSIAHIYSAVLDSNNDATVTVSTDSMKYLVIIIGGASGGDNYSIRAEASANPVTSSVSAPLALLLKPGVSGNTFLSEFQGSTDGWSVVSGNWSIVSNDYYYTAGLGTAEMWSSIVHSNTYEDLDFEVEFQRDPVGCDTCANAVLFRGTPNPLGSSNAWHSYYYFGITNIGSYLVGERIGGVWNSWTSWTDSDRINQGGVNRLRVVAQGSQLTYYINGSPVYSASDTSLTSGKLGVAMYSNTSPDGFSLDWATQTLGSSADMQEGSYPPAVSVTGPVVPEHRSPAR